MPALTLLLASLTLVWGGPLERVASPASSERDYRYVCTNDQPGVPNLPRVCVPIPV